MYQIQRQDDNIKMLGIIDQMTRTANEQRNAERAQAMQRFAMFRSLGDAKRAAEELNRAQGKGWLSKLFGDYNKPEDFYVSGEPGSVEVGPRPEADPNDIAAAQGGFSSLGKELLQQAKAGTQNEEFSKIVGQAESKGLSQAFQEALTSEGGSKIGEGVGFGKEIESGFGPKARAALATLEAKTDTSEHDEYMGRVKKRLADVSEAQDRYDRLKIKNMSARKLPPNATDQYDFYMDQYNAARATGKPGLIKDAYNDLVHKFKLLDNKWGWNMSAGLKDLRPNFPGGAGGGKKVLWKERGSERKQYLPEGQVPKDSENWVPIDSEDSAAMRRDLMKLDEQIAQAREAGDKKVLATLIARRRQIEGKSPETIQNFVPRMDNALINPYLAYNSGQETDTRNIADNTPTNKNDLSAKPKYKEGYLYEVNGKRMLWKNGRWVKP